MYQSRCWYSGQGTGTLLYSYTVQVQWYRGIMVQYTGTGKDTLFRYTKQLNCKGTGKVAASTVTQYSYTV